MQASTVSAADHKKLHLFDADICVKFVYYRSAYKETYAFRDKIDIEGVDHPQRMFDLTEGLIRRGYSDDDILGILGGNFRRVLTEIWSAHEAYLEKKRAEAEREEGR